MQIAESPGAVKRLRKAAGPYQRSFATPLDALAGFVEAILAPHAPMTGAVVTIDSVVFRPRHVEELLTGYQLPLQHGHDWTITASGQDESRALLQAALGDWLDFFFAPAPKRFMIYADHDECTTIISATKGPVSRTAASLLSRGFRELADYERHLRL